MGERIFLAGAAGAVGRRLVPLLREAGHSVVGTTRSPDRVTALRDAGVEPVIVDVFDAEALARAVEAARPSVVIHQLTDLPAGLDPATMAAAIRANARIRDEGTRNLVQAAVVAGARRLIAQSIAWAYAPGPLPRPDDALLDIDAEGDRGVSVRGVAALEAQVLDAAGIEGVVLRYGRLYGPGTGAETPPAAMPLHVDAAAHAALLAVQRGTGGIYTVAEPNGEVMTTKAVAEFGWRPDFRLDDAGMAV